MMYYTSHMITCNLSVQRLYITHGWTQHQVLTSASHFCTPMSHTLHSCLK